MFFLLLMFFFFAANTGKHYFNIVSGRFPSKNFVFAYNFQNFLLFYPVCEPTGCRRKKIYASGVFSKQTRLIPGIPLKLQSTMPASR